MSIHKYERPKSSTLVQTAGIPWTNIPPEVKEEISEVERFTKDTGREGSITMCKKADKKRLFVGNNFKGNKDSTFALNCNSQFGKSARIGSVHSHPVNSETVGVSFSEGDLYVTLEDSYKNKIEQIDCVTSHETPLIPCAMPREIPDRKKLVRYERALDDSIADRKTDPYFLDNVYKDFHIALFNRHTGKREDNPSPKKVIRAAFGRSNRVLREKVKVFERGAFCEYIADLMGQHDNDEVINECRAELRRKSFLGLIDVE